MLATALPEIPVPLELRFTNQGQSPADLRMEYFAFESGSGSVPSLLEVGGASAIYLEESYLPESVVAPGREFRGLLAASRPGTPGIFQNARMWTVGRHRITVVGDPALSSDNIRSFTFEELMYGGILGHPPMVAAVGSFDVLAPTGKDLQAMRALRALHPEGNSALYFPREKAAQAWELAKGTAYAGYIALSSSSEADPAAPSRLLEALSMVEDDPFLEDMIRAELLNMLARQWGRVASGVSEDTPRDEFVQAVEREAGSDHRMQTDFGRRLWLDSRRYVTDSMDYAQKSIRHRQKVATQPSKDR